MAILLTVDHELSCVLELLRVSVRSRERKQHPIVGLHRAPMEVVVVFNETRHGHWSVRTKELFKSKHHDVWLIDETLQVIWVGSEVPER